MAICLWYFTHVAVLLNYNYKANKPEVVEFIATKETLKRDYVNKI